MGGNLVRTKEIICGCLVPLVLLPVALSFGW